MGREEEIRQIAYAIWEEEYCPHGRDGEHWLMAEAIWEEREKAGKAGAVSTASAPKGPARRTAKKVTAAGKRSRKTPS